MGVQVGGPRSVQRLRLPLILACGAAAALAAPAAARAAVFVVLASTPDAVSLIDPATIQTLGPETVRRAWSVSVKRTLTSDGPPQPGYIRTLNDYDCATRQVRWRTFQVYSRFGDLVMKQDNRAPGWTPTTDVEGASGLRVVCDHAAGASVVSGSSMAQLVLSLMQGWDPQPAAPLADPPPKKKAAARKPPHKVRS